MGTFAPTVAVRVVSNEVVVLLVVITQGVVICFIGYN